MALTKSIMLSEKTYNLLKELCPKSKTYDEIIYESLLNYTEEEYLTDEEAGYCNSAIDQFEKNNYSNVVKLNIDELDNELDQMD